MSSRNSQSSICICGTTGWKHYDSFSLHGVDAKHYLSLCDPVAKPVLVSDPAGQLVRNLKGIKEVKHNPCLLYTNQKPYPEVGKLSWLGHWGATSCKPSRCFGTVLETQKTCCNLIVDRLSSSCNTYRIQALGS